MKRPAFASLSLLILAALIAALPRLVAAEPAGLLTNAHAHNDYEHPHPLFDALDHHFCSVEADIFLVNGRLLVGHTLSHTTPEKTLQALYLDPLHERVKKNGGHVFTNGPEFTLLIDLKQDWRTLYPPLHSALTNYADMLTTFHDGVKQTNAIIVIITGNRNQTMFASETIRYAALDGAVDDLEQNPSRLLIPWISADWRREFHWNGYGIMPETEFHQLESLVGRAHAQGRLTRFWGAPDFPNFWHTMRAAGVDLINTDDLAGAERYFKELQPANSRP